MNARFDRWCRAAVDQIRYGPDRKDVYDELYAHLEDRYEAELDRWETPEEAMEATLNAMGSASELAPQLAAVHRPFWGYALTCTRWLIGFLLVLLSIDLVVFLGSNRKSDGYIPWYYENPGAPLVNVWEDGAGVFHIIGYYIALQNIAIFVFWLGIVQRLKRPNITPI